MKGGKYAKTLVKIQVRAIRLNFYSKQGLNSPQARILLSSLIKKTYFFFFIKLQNSKL